MQRMFLFLLFVFMIFKESIGKQPTACSNAGGVCIHNEVACPSGYVTDDKIRCCGNHRCCVETGCTDDVVCDCKATCGENEKPDSTNCTNDGNECKPNCSAVGDHEVGDCCGNDKCCCTDDPGCRCGDFCIDSENADISGTCCDGTKTCCRPCTLNTVCEAGNQGKCLPNCTSEFPIDNGPCCDDGGGNRCCLQCSSCVDGGGVCGSKHEPCPVGKPFEVGSCCKNGKCCAAEQSCHKFYPPRRCVPANDDSCGPSVGGSVHTGFCPLSNIKCCPYCGFLCQLDFNGTCAKSSHCTETSTNEDCCSPEKCCYEP